MKQVQVGMVVMLMMLCCSLFGQAQQTGATSSNVVVPTLVSFSGVLTGSNGKPLTNITGVTFSLYAEQEGGSPLWLETQNVQPDKMGQYSVMLGSTTSQGLPASLFVSGQARWLGVQAQGQEPQPRVMLLSVPYALKAGDAQTLGGKPASAFATASGVNSSGQNGVLNNTISGGGTKDYVPLWLSKSKLGSSNIFQSTGGDLGISTTSPAANLDVNGTSDIRNTLTLFPNGSAPTLLINGTAFQVSNTGNVTFIGGQTFPGTGTVTSVGSGTGLTGGPITNSGTLSVATGGVTNAMLANSSLTVTAGTALTGGGAVSLGGSTTLNVDTTKVPLLASANTFTTNQSITGNLSDTGNISATGQVSGATGYFNSASSGTPTLSASQTGTSQGAYISSAGGTGVLAVGATEGIVASSSAATNGVGVAGSTTNGYGIFGEDHATTGASIGVAGISQSSSGSGVFGNAGASTGSTVGVLGTGSSPDGYGVLGSSPNLGVAGAADGNSQTGLEVGSYAGVWGDTGGSGYSGVVGTADNANAGFFINNSPLGSFTLVAAADTTTAGAAHGILGQAYCCSSEYDNLVNTADAGIWGDTGEAAGTSTAIIGTADDNWSARFFNNSATHTTLNAQNDTTTSTALVFKTIGSQFSGECTIDVKGDLHCTGSKSADVSVDGGARKVALYAVEAPDNWFEDFGSGVLTNGAATVTLDPTFVQTVNTTLEYHVFLTPKGDSDGLYVSNETPQGFEVHEQHAGRSNIAFDYRIVAKRVGYENVRLEDVTERYRETAEELAQQRQNQGKHPMPQRLTRPSAPRPLVPQPRPPLPVRPAAQPLNAEHK